jgi:hypothetical protein
LAIAYIASNLSAQDTPDSSGSLALADAAARYGISAQTLRRLCDGKQLDCERDSRGWRIRPGEVENYLLARRPAGRQSVGLWLQGPAPNWRAKDGVGWRFKALVQGGRQLLIEIWFTNELVAILQRDEHDVRDIVVRGAEHLVNDALLETDVLTNGQEIWFGSADRSFVLNAAGLGDDSYLPSEAPLEDGVSVLYDFTVRDGIWPGDSITLDDALFVDVVVDSRAEAGVKRVRAIRMHRDDAVGTRAQAIQQALRRYEMRCRRLGRSLSLWVVGVAARSRALTMSQQRVLDLVVDSWQAAGEWPVYGFVEGKLEAEYDTELKDLIATFPQGLLWGVSPYMQPNDRLAVTIAGLTHCPSAGVDLDLFMRTVRFLVERRRAFNPSTPTQAENLKVTSVELAENLGGSVPPGIVARLYDLVMQDPFLQHGSGKSVDGSWEVIVGPESRRYRGVETVEEYLRRRQPDSSPWGQPAATAPVNTPLTSLSQVMPAPIPSDEPSDDEGQGTSYLSDVFVLMPFADEFDDVWAAIKDVSARRNLKCIRADTITLPGRITAQIMDAIRAATAIVADVTGNNPNVMFELGYADALGKPIVVLNQKLAEAPFDLKDWRQITYSIKALETMQRTLSQFLDQVVVNSRPAGPPTADLMRPAPDRPIISIRGSTVPGSTGQLAELAVRNVGTRAALECRAAIAGNGVWFLGQSVAVGAGEDMRLAAVGRNEAVPAELLPHTETQAVFYRDPDGWVYRTTYQGRTDWWRAGIDRPNWVSALDAATVDGRK